MESVIALLTVFVVYHNGNPSHALMYGELEAAREYARELKEYDRRDKVEIKTEKFKQSEVYYIGEHPEYGHIYALNSELAKGNK